MKSSTESERDTSACTRRSTVDLLEGTRIMFEKEERSCCVGCGWVA